MIIEISTSAAPEEDANSAEPSLLTQTNYINLTVMVYRFFTYSR